MPDFLDGGIADLNRALASGEISAADLARASLDRIAALDRSGPSIRAVIETNPDAEEIARALDAERAEGHVRGPLHGIPILLKDNIDTADANQTTAGSLALIGLRRQQDAHVAACLRKAGAVLMGKLNLSEWANFRSSHSSSGWSARGGQALNPYVLDRTTCGSSAGSGSAVAAGYVPASIGTETSGSILCPAAMCGVVGIKPTVGLTSRAGVIPISHSQDTIGPFARTVEDAAIVLGAIAGRDPRDPATMDTPEGLDFTRGLDPRGLHGARIGVPRDHFFGYDTEADRVVDASLERMRALGAELIDPVVIPSIERIKEERVMIEVLLYEFKSDLNDYLAGLPTDFPIRSLADLIEFNLEHEAEEMPFFGQDIFELSQEKGPLTEPAYIDLLATSQRLSREQGIDAAMQTHRLDALVAPTTGRAWKIDLENGDSSSGGMASLPAMAGYPAVTVPAGFAGELPIGLAFFGRAYSEPLLLKLAHAFEAASEGFRPPRYLPTAG